MVEEAMVEEEEVSTLVCVCVTVTVCVCRIWRSLTLWSNERKLWTWRRGRRTKRLSSLWTLISFYCVKKPYYIIIFHSMHIVCKSFNKKICN